jgi:hypothetical protein
MINATKTLRSLFVFAVVLSAVACQPEPQEEKTASGSCAQVAENIASGLDCDDPIETYQEDCERFMADGAEIGCAAEYDAMAACSASNYTVYECDEDGPTIIIECEDLCEAVFDTALDCMMENI